MHHALFVNDTLEQDREVQATTIDVSDMPHPQKGTKLPTHEPNVIRPLHSDTAHIVMPS